MTKVALAAAIALLLFFTYLTGVRPAFAFAYALCLLFVVSWAWPRLAIRRMQVSRKLDPGIPTVGEPFEEVIEVRRSGWVPAGATALPASPESCVNAAERSAADRKLRRF